MTTRISDRRRTAPRTASLTALLAAPLTLAVTAPAAAQIVFEPPVGYPLGVGIFSNESMATGDVDGDGDVDAVLGGFFLALGVELLPNQGDGTFGAPISLDHLVNTSVGSVDLTDLDGDGDLDLVITQGQVTVALNDGAGGFPSGTAVLTGFAQSVAGVGDVTGDGLTDIVVTASVPFGATRMFLLPGLGDGTFGPEDLLFEPASILLGAPQLADLDGDGALDIVITPGFGTECLVFLSGDGLLPSAVPLPDSPARVALIDVDADGHPDLVTVSAEAHQLHVQLGAGGATFGPASSWDVVTGPRDIAAVDFDADGLLDLAVSGLNAHAVEVLRGDGAGGFSSTVIVSNAYAPWSVAAHDLDGDGRGDLVVSSGDNSNPLQVLHNHTYEAASAYADEGGQGLGGTGYPILLADGKPLPGRPVSFRLENAAPGTSAFLVLGFSALFLPLGSGVLGPSPDVVFGPFPIGVSQQFEAGGIWPSGVPAGTTLRLQYWLADPAAAGGYAPTSTVRVAVP